MGLDAGARDVRVTVQAKTNGTDDSGFPIEAWVDLVALYAQKRVLTTAEAFRAGRESAVEMVAFVIPYRPDVDPDRIDLPATRRILDRGRTYDIVGADAQGRKALVRVLCEASTAAGTP